MISIKAAVAKTAPRRNLLMVAEDGRSMFLTIEGQNVSIGKGRGNGFEQCSESADEVIAYLAEQGFAPKSLTKREEAPPPYGDDPGVNF